MSADLLLRDVEVDGRRVDVLVDEGRVASVGPGLHLRGAEHEVTGDGGALIPGLHDHHIHLLALAAARESVDLFTGSTPAADAIRRADRERPGHEWLRVVGYHESMLGELDREALDALVPGRPTRVQHRSGSMWILNSAALDLLGDALITAPAGVERDAQGRPTGRFMRVDTWLRHHVPSVEPDLGRVAEELRRSGITGVTDMTPYDTLDDARPLLDGSLPLRVTISGSPALTSVTPPSTVAIGPVKIIVDEHDPPPFEELAEWVRAAHRQRRNVAVHCVTRSSVALMIAVWDEAGALDGDRVEHGAVVPPELADALATRGITVVTQPAFVRCRGDEYLTDVEADDIPHLWPCQSLLDRGVAVAASTDAPYGPADPWIVIQSAVSRTTATGRPIGPAEAVTARRALDMFLGPPNDPGGPPRRIEVGAPAHLCLLDRPLIDALARPSVAHVRCTWLGGR